MSGEKMSGPRVHTSESFGSSRQGSLTEEQRQLLLGKVAGQAEEQGSAPESPTDTRESTHLDDIGPELQGEQLELFDVPSQGKFGGPAELPDDFEGASIYTINDPGAQRAAQEAKAAADRRPPNMFELNEELQNEAKGLENAEDVESTPTQASVHQLIPQAGRAFHGASRSREVSRRVQEAAAAASSTASSPETSSEQVASTAETIPPIPEGTDISAEPTPIAVEAAQAVNRQAGRIGEWQDARAQRSNSAERSALTPEQQITHIRERIEARRNELQSQINEFNAWVQAFEARAAQRGSAPDFGYMSNRVNALDILDRERGADRTPDNPHRHRRANRWEQFKEGKGPLRNLARRAVRQVVKLGPKARTERKMNKHTKKAQHHKIRADINRVKLEKINNKPTRKERKAAERAGEVARYNERHAEQRRAWNESGLGQQYAEALRRRQAQGLNR